MTETAKYSFSFTGASALIAETLVIAGEYARLQDWEAVRKSLLDNNLLNKIKVATFKREFAEIKKRLSRLTPDQLAILTEGSLDDARLMIWLSLVKTYTFIKDFIIEIVRNKYQLFDNVLTESDYIRFFNAKSVTHPELAGMTDVTTSKVKQRIFTILEQVGLISQTKNGIILRPLLSNEVLDVIISDDPYFLGAFLYSNEEIKIIMQKSRHA